MRRCSHCTERWQHRFGSVYLSVSVSVWLWVSGSVNAPFSSLNPVRCSDLAMFCFQDSFFYSLVYDPQQKTLLADKGEIRVGSKFQAQVNNFPKLKEGKFCFHGSTAFICTVRPVRRTLLLNGINLCTSNLVSHVVLKDILRFFCSAYRGFVKDFDQLVKWTSNFWNPLVHTEIHSSTILINKTA